MCRFSPLLLFRDRHAGQCVSEHCPVDTRFGAVVRKQYFGPDNPGCLDEHRIVHRIGYIFRQKGDVDSLQPGHFNGEELGMKYAVNWLKELVEEKIPVVYCCNEDMYDLI